MAQRKAGDREAADATLGLALKIAEGLKDPERSRSKPWPEWRSCRPDSGDRVAARATLDRRLKLAAIVPATDKLVQQVISAARARTGDWEGGREAALGLRERP